MEMTTPAPATSTHAPGSPSFGRAGTGVAVDHTADLATLAALASKPHALADVLRGALESLRDVVPYDLAAIYELKDDKLALRLATGPVADERISGHELELRKFPTIRRALELRRPVALDEHHHHGGEGDPYDGILDLPAGHSCMVVPLFAADHSLGIITLDRTSCGAYPAEIVQLAGVYGQIVSIAMEFAEQTRLLATFRRQLREENRLLKEENGAQTWAIRQLDASQSPVMQQTVRLARQVATADLPVLILGETGTGKEVLAQAIHAWSSRSEGPFVKLNCAAIPENLVESELFGHVKGAFSGAVQARDGRFATANGGTLLLDEIGDMPAAAQAKLLRVLQEGTFEPVGSDETVRVDVRVIAASHVDLAMAVERGEFREDLYYRLAAFPLRLPPLRDRLEDLPTIAGDILGRLERRTGRGPWSLSGPARASLLAHGWPGNIRELANAIERATIVRAAGEIQASDLAIAPSPRPADPIDLGGNEELPDFAQMQRRYFTEVLRRTSGRIYGEDGAAVVVGLKPTTLQSRLKKLGLEPAAFRK
jgi:transcriptional regulator with GAF, ATPase, and Fis domain